MRLLQKIDDVLAACEKGLIVVLFSLLTLLMVFNIVSRNILHVSYQQALEVTPALVLWLALIGSSLALKNRRHIRLEIFLRYCPPLWRRTAEGAGCVFGMAVMSLLLWASLDFVRNEVALFGPAGWATVVFPLFFVLAVFRYLVLMLNPAPQPDRGDTTP